jgi:hypothetical protein
MKQSSERVPIEGPAREAGERLEQLVSELGVVEAFVSTRLAAMRSEIDALRTALGLSGPTRPEDGTPLDLPFRKPFVLEVAPVTLYTDFFPGWQLGAAAADLRCTVQQLPAPESALTYPNYRLIVRLRREGSKNVDFLSLELDVSRSHFPKARACDTAVRLRVEPRGVVKPSLRVFLDDGTWHDLWGKPFEVGPEFGSYGTTFEMPETFGDDKRPIATRLIYYLPSDAELELDVAYLINGFRSG